MALMYNNATWIPIKDVPRETTTMNVITEEEGNEYYYNRSRDDKKHAIGVRLGTATRTATGNGNIYTILAHKSTSIKFDDLLTEAKKEYQEIVGY